MDGSQMLSSRMPARRNSSDCSIWEGITDLGGAAMPEGRSLPCLRLSLGAERSSTHVESHQIYASETSALSLGDGAFSPRF